MFPLAQMGESGGGAAVGGGLFMVIQLVLIVFYLIVGWKIFTKAGKPGWAVIIPIYNVIVMLQIAGKPVWWVILMFIPIVNIIIAILASLGMAENFGKSAGFGIGLFFLGFIFGPILAFGSAEYTGGAAPAAA